MKRQEERHAEERQNFMEVMSHNVSNSRCHVSPRSTENVDDAHHHDAPFQEDEVVRSDAHVALGIIISTNPKTVVGGVALGKQYCEVVVNHVLKRDAALTHTYPGVEKIADAHKLSIAWPYNRVKQQASKPVRKASKLPLSVSAGGEKCSGLAAGGEKS